MCWLLMRLGGRLALMSESLFDLYTMLTTNGYKHLVHFAIVVFQIMAGGEFGRKLYEDLH